MKAHIYDYDGTLIENVVNDDNILSSHKLWNVCDWDNFIKLAKCAKSNDVVVSMANSDFIDELVIIVTARPEKYRAETESDLLDREIDYDVLVMRPNDMVRREYDECFGKSGQDLVDIVHKHHAKYRKLVIDILKYNKSLQLFEIKLDLISATDDQKANLEVFKSYGMDTYIVNERGGVSFYG